VLGDAAQPGRVQPGGGVEQDRFGLGDPGGWQVGGGVGQRGGVG
jgi:hypothetical protein